MVAIEGASIGVFIATGVISSFVAAVVFLVFLRAIRPKIVICDCIAQSEFREDGRGSHSIKVINKSLFSLIGVDLRLDLIRTHTAPPEGRPLLTVSNIPLLTEHLFDIPGYRPWDAEAKYSVRFAVLGELFQQWPDDPNNYLLFRLAATHSLSGFRKVFSKRTPSASVFL